MQVLAMSKLFGPRLLTTSSILSILLSTPVKANDTYAWVYANEFCEMKGYGLSVEMAAVRAQQKIDENQIYIEQEMRDRSVRLPNGYTLSVTRKMREIAKKCP